MRLATIIFLICTSAHALKLSDLVIDAKSAFLRDDHFQSARLYSLAINQKQESVETEDIENYIVSQSILLSESEFVSFCESMSRDKKGIEFRFYCAKTLIAKGFGGEGLKFLENIPTSFHRLEYHLIRATGFLLSGKSNFCADEIAKAQKKVTENTSQHFKDLLNVTEARCYVDQQRFELALQKFQNIRVNSEFYLSTLEEQAWVQFKMRNLGSSRELLNIIISDITSQNQALLDRTDVYFRVKYLLGYIDLISQNPERSRSTFDSINQEIRKYRDTALRRAQVAAKVTKAIQDASTKQLIEDSKPYIEFRKFVKIWNQSHQLNEVDEAIRFLVALNQEQVRVKKIISDTSYTAQLVRLKNKHIEYLSEVFKEQFNEAKRTIDSIQFKSSMGQIENVWAQRTEGKRTIAEALDSYNRELGGVEEYLGK